MISLLTLVPLPYRFLALAALAISVFGYGYVKGLHHEEAELDSFRTATELAAAKQAESTARVINQQKEVSDNVSQDYEQRLAALRARYAGMRNPVSGSGSVPAVAVNTQGPDGAAEELPARCADPAIATNFAANAAEDALKIVMFQRWVREQGFRVDQD